jgi:hypothetical protein
MYLATPINSLHITASSKIDTRQAVSSEARVHSQANQDRIYGGQCALRQVYLPVLWLSAVSITPPLRYPHSLIESPKLYNINNKYRR